MFPNLAGQSVAALYKQLVDYKSGKRNSEVMGVYVAQLSQQQMIDLVTHFASLPNPFANAAPKPASIDAAARTLVESGSPMRNIASCAACHGPMVSCLARRNCAVSSARTSKNRSGVQDG